MSRFAGSRAWRERCAKALGRAFSIGLGAFLGFGAAEVGAFPLSTSPTQERAETALSQLDRGWVVNAGQWDERARFAAQGVFGTTWISDQGEILHQVVAASPRPKARRSAPGDAPGSSEGVAGWVLAERFLGGRIPNTVGREVLPERVSYFVGEEAHHRANLSTYRRVDLGEVYPGITVALQAAQRNVEKLFAVQPGAHPEAIRIAVAGAQGLRVTAAGSLEAQTAHGPIVFSAPIAYQEIDGQRLAVPVRYNLDAQRGEYGFLVAAYDRSLPLIIDPLLQSTHLGGSDRSSNINAMAIDDTLGVYVTGYTNDSTFPTTVGAYQTTAGTAFLARFNSALTSLIASTYFGGGRTEALAIAISPGSDQVFIAGTSRDDLPGVVPGISAQGTRGGWKEDGFVARFNTALSVLYRSTYLGGADEDYAFALHFHPNSYLYVGGKTKSGDFPFTAGAFASTLGGGENGFVARLHPSLEVNPINRSTYFGGNNGDQVSDIASSASEIFVVGTTSSSNLPNRTNALAGLRDSFLARLSPDLASNPVTRYFGGSMYESGAALALHPTNGDLYFCGVTSSRDLPATTGAVQATHPGSDYGASSFLARANAATLEVVRATYFGVPWRIPVPMRNRCVAIAIHPGGSEEIYITGKIDDSGLPNTLGGAQPIYRGGHMDAYLGYARGDAYVARFNQSLSSNPQTTYLGGGEDDVPASLKISATGEVYVAGWTESSDFPGTRGGAQATIDSLGAGFVSRFTPDLAGFADGPLNPAIPALSPWGLLALASALGVFAAGRLRFEQRRKR